MDTAIRILGFRAPKAIRSTIFESIIELIKANQVPNAYVKCIFFRTGSGKYQPENDDLEFIIKSTPLDSDDYGDVGTGLKLGDYKDNMKPMTELSNIKTNNSLVYVLAQRFAVHNQFDDVCIYNTEGRITEASASCLFILRDHRLITPPLSEGAVDSTMKYMVMNAASDLSIDLREEGLQASDVEEAEEVFIASAVKGIRSIREYHSSTYGSDTATRLQEYINSNLQRYQTRNS